VRECEMHLPEPIFLPKKWHGIATPGSHCYSSSFGTSLYYAHVHTR
jgi:hypothetical protein